MIKDVGGKFHVCSISPKIRQILVHWRHELIERDLFFQSLNIFLVNTKMSHYWFNKKELLQKAKE